MSSEEHESELNPLPSESESTLSERVAQLEQKLDDLLMLLSDVYRYGKLRDLLAEGKWKEADLETTKIMLEISGKGSQDVFTPEDVKTFPCNAIRLIDQLWKKYSNDRFGFSVQLRIYRNRSHPSPTLSAVVSLFECLRQRYLPQGDRYLPQGDRYLPQGDRYLPQRNCYF